MGDTYQAVYDAVRSKISNGDVGRAVADVVRESGIGHCADMVRATAQEAAAEYQRPSVLYRPSLTADGDEWCALYGDDLASGVAGFGNTPEHAMAAFDRAWRGEKTPAAKRNERVAP